MDYRRELEKIIETIEILEDRLKDQQIALSETERLIDYWRSKVKTMMEG